MFLILMLISFLMMFVYIHIIHKPYTQDLIRDTFGIILLFLSGLIIGIFEINTALYNKFSLTNNIIYEQMSHYNEDEYDYVVLKSQFGDVKFYKIKLQEQSKFYKYENNELVPFKTGDLF